MSDMAPILLYYAFKATMPFVDALVNECLRQLLPSTNDCLRASSPWMSGTAEWRAISNICLN